MISAQQLRLDRGNKTLINDATFTIYPQHKVGLVGANGCGKSSLFAALLGQLQPDHGDLTFPSQWAIATVKQETPALARSALDYVMDGDTEFRQIEHQLEQARQKNDGILEAELLAKMETIGGYTLAARAGELLHGLGFLNDQLSHHVKAFSGGWRMRLNLAQALISRADLLLLDEPTNHLDLDAVLWLQRWLKQYAGTLILISHDRDFLDDVVGQIIHIEQQQATLYSGNYTAFERQRAEKLAQQDAQFKKQQREIKHLTAFVDRFRAKASKAKQAQSRLKRLQKLPELAPAHVDSQFSFSFSNPAHLPHPLMSLEQADCGYDVAATPILSAVNLTVVPGHRIGLLGRNGAGKSTFIKSLAAAIPLLSGQRFNAQDLRIGYFSQHQLDQLRLGHSPLQHILLAKPEMTDLQGRSYLGQFGFSGDQALAVVDNMSGGEKARLVLALIVLAKPQVLLLDEPTNHLDLEMRQALVMALQEFNGALILIAHDRYLLESCVDEFYLIANGAFTAFDGDIDDYQKWLNDDKKDAFDNQRKDKNNAEVDKKAARKAQAELRQQAAPLKKKADQLNDKIELWRQQLSDVESLLADPSIYQAEHKQNLTQQLKRRAELVDDIDCAELEWLTLEEQIEAIMLGN